MARFGSRILKFSMGVREAEVEHYANGREKVIEKPLEAQFGPVGDLQDNEYEQIKRKLVFHGLPEDKETEEKVDPRSRMGVFDSELAQKLNHWSDEDTDLVVQALRESYMNGIEYIELEQPRVPAPWSNYDAMDDPEKIVAVLEATGTDPRTVLAYERENENRREVTAALVELLGDGAEEKEVVINAN